MLGGNHGNYKIRYKTKAFITDPAWNINTDDMPGTPDHLTGQPRLDYFRQQLLADSAPRIIEDIEILS